MTETRSCSEGLLNKFEVLGFSAVFLLFLVFSASVYISLPIPEDELALPSKSSSVITDRNGIILRKSVSEDGNVFLGFVPSEDISSYMKNAIVSVEDKRFYAHGGIDVCGIARAFSLNIKERAVVAGGSTLTQQLAKIALGGRDRNIANKLLETLYALRIEAHFSKDEILAFYMNRVSFGPSIEGIGAASEFYFGKPPSELSAAQAALLASVPLQPSYYDPYRNFDAVAERGKLILSLMREQKLISEYAYDSAMEERVSVSGPDFPFEAPHFCDYVSSELKKRDSWESGIVRSSLDLRLQKSAEGILKASIAGLKKNNVNDGAVIAADAKTGEILIMAGSADFFSGKGQNNGCLALRQAGSSLKPFLYALAIDSGMNASDVIPDTRLVLNDANGAFMPLNYDSSFHGPVRMRNALACSYNIPALRVISRIGVSPFLKKLRELGFDSADLAGEVYGAGLALGDAEVSLLSLARAYRCFSSGGLIVPLTPFLSDGSAEERRVFSDESSFIIYDILSDNTARMPAFGSSSPLRLPFPCAVKTGTTKNYRDNWCIGATDDFVVGVWAGNFDGSPMNGVSGVTGAGPVFNEVMKLLYEGRELPLRKNPPAGVIKGKICSLSGMAPSTYCRSVRDEYFKGEPPKEVCSWHKMSVIDIRNGARASENTPLEFRRDKILEILPHIYDQWLREKGIRASDDELISNFSCREKIFSIVFPSDGDSFVIDRASERHFQKLQFEASSAGRDGEKITWFLNGKRIGDSSYPSAFEWPMKEGSYVLRASCGGCSDEVSFSVR